jgi:hypothetical protein
MTASPDAIRSNPDEGLQCYIFCRAALVVRLLNDQLRVTLCIADFNVEVTVRLYVPAGVPLGLPPFELEELLPPQEEISSSEPAIMLRYSPAEWHFFHAFGTRTMPIRMAAQKLSKGIFRWPIATMLRDVVDTETLTFDAVVAFTAAVEGTVQVAPCGTPVQAKLAEPPILAPPMDNV